VSLVRDPTKMAKSIQFINTHRDVNSVTVIFEALFRSQFHQLTCYGDEDNGWPL